MKKGILFWISILFCSGISILEFSSCEKPVCSEISCYNGGVCRDGFCNCKDGWIGKECNVKPNLALTGRYVGNTKPGDGVYYQDSILMLADTATVDTMLLSFGYGIDDNIVVRAQTLNEHDFFFDRTYLGSNPDRFVEGRGTVENGRLNFFFSYLVPGDTTINCFFIGEKDKGG